MKHSFLKRISGLALPLVLISQVFGAVYAADAATAPTGATVPALANAKSDDNNIAKTGTGRAALYTVDHFGNALAQMTDGVKNSGGDDSWNNAPRNEDYWGISFDGNYGFNKAVFTTGNMFPNGGGFGDGVKIQVRQNGSWVDVTSIISPPAPYDVAYKSYTFTFNDTWGDAVRVYGKPAHAKEDVNTFTSVGELELYYMQSQTLEEIIPASVKLSEGDLALSIGDAKQIFTEIYDRSNNRISGLNFNWTSSNESVATVDNGFVTAKALGSTVIRAENGLFSTSLVISVCKSEITPTSTKGMYLLSDVSGDKLRFKYEGGAAPATEATVTISVYDAYNSVAYEKESKVTADQNGALNADLPIVINSPGYYETNVSVEGTGASFTTAYKFGVVPGPHKGVRPDSFFASNPFMVNPDFDYLVGVKVYRTHSAQSGAVNPEGSSIVKPEYWRPELDPKRQFTDDMFDFTNEDSKIQILKKYDMSVIGVVGYANPEWARTQEAQSLNQYGPPRDYDEFINVTVPSIKHYYDQGLIKYVEFWNEPWIYGWTWADSGERFRELQNKWWAAASKVMPNLKLIAGHSSSFTQDHLFIDQKTVSNIFTDPSHPYTEVMDQPNSREGRSLRTYDFQVRNAEANGIHTHFLTEDGIYFDNGETQFQKDTAGKVITHNVMAALSGIYQGNYLDGMQVHPNELPGSVVYGVMTNYLEDRVPVADIWPENQLIYGAIYANKKFASLDMPRAKEFSARWNVDVPDEYKNDQTKVAVIWNLTGKDKDNLTAGTITIDMMKDMKAYNMYGAPVGIVDNGKLKLPFFKDPVYIVSDELSVKELNDIIQKGRIAEAQPVNMYFDLITSPLTDRNAKLAVTLQNQLNTNIKGSLQLALPDGWELAQNQVHFEIKSGEIKKLQLPIKKAAANDLNLYPVKATANVEGFGNVDYEQTLQVAVAPKKTIAFTGKVSDFAGVTPTTLDSRALALGTDWTYYLLHPNENPPAGTPDKYIVTKSYTAYDDQYLYLGYAVNEPEFVHDSNADLNGHGSMPIFWDSINISIGFGERNKNSLRSADDPWAWKGAYRDMDYNYDLFKDKNGVDHLYRLRDPNSPRTYPYQTEDAAKYYPYVGEVSGAKINITRDEANKITLYQVAVPLSEIGLNKGVKEPFRLGYVQSNDEGFGLLEYSVAAGGFDYRVCGDSFNPTWANLHALSTWIGFDSGKGTTD